MQTTLINELDRVRAELQVHGRIDNFYDSLSASYRKYGSLTERQEAALKRSLTTYHDRNERVVAGRQARVISSPIPTGRVTIVGKVISTKWVENDFGGSTKMLVESEQGWRVYGTLPARLNTGEPLHGAKVVFTAAVTPKESDFGFFARPTGGAVLTDEHPQPEAKEKAPYTLPTDGWGSHRKVSIAPDLKPEELLPATTPWIEAATDYATVQAGPNANHPVTFTPKAGGLAAMVAAAGYAK